MDKSVLLYHLKLSMIRVI